MAKIAVEEYKEWQKTQEYATFTRDEFNAEIQKAREETFKEVCEFIKNHLNDDYISVDEESARIGCPYRYLETNLFIEDLKKTLKNNIKEKKKRL